MFRKLVAVMICALAMLGWPESGSAQFAPGSRATELAAAQTAISQQLPKYALLVALGIDRDDSVFRLERLRSRFDRVLEGFRNGDSVLGLVQSTSLEFNAELDRADEIWREMNAELLAGIAVADFKPEQVVRVAELSVALQHSMTEATAIVAATENDGRSFSMLLTAIRYSDRQRILIEQMTKEMLLVAYGHDVTVNRALLGQTATEFAETVGALIEGDMDRQLLPAPTAAIRDRLVALQRLWRADFEPIVEGVLVGESLDDRALRRIAEINAQLLERSNEVIALYRNL